MHVACPYLIFSCILFAASVLGLGYTFSRPEFVITDSSGYSHLTSGYGDIILKLGFTLATVVSLFLVVVYFREACYHVEESDGPIYVIMTPEDPQPPPTYSAYV